jgi:hypothetical protein
MLNLRYQELGQCATWTKGSTDTAFYARILPSCHGLALAAVTMIIMKITNRQRPG